MAIKDVLLTLTSYPDPTPLSIIDTAVSLASSLGAQIAALACEARVQVPGSLLSGAGHVGSLIASEARKSLKNAQVLLAAFQQAAERSGAPHEVILERCLTSEVPHRFAEYARVRDLTIVPVPESRDQWYAEAIIFGSGRPTLVVSETSSSKRMDPNRVLVAWDFSRAAARAVADAIPILEKAREVRIVTVSREKVLPSTRSPSEVAKNLARHGIDVIIEEVEAAGRPIGEILATQAAACNADLLVMGAYGHSRFREFVLGGATRSILARPPIPVMFSH
jgi:nucleotide-binding universal stress UspA family protein